MSANVPLSRNITVFLSENFFVLLLFVNAYPDVKSSLLITGVSIPVPTISIYAYILLSYFVKATKSTLLPDEHVIIELTVLSESITVSL